VKGEGQQGWSLSLSNYKEKHLENNPRCVKNTFYASRVVLLSRAMKPLK